jgi:ubiquinone/menaquinone biosynthesis C-methylase UbiE
MTRGSDHEVVEGWSAAASLFDNVSFFVSDALSHATQRLNPGPGQRVLDVGTGTGVSARNAARFGARVVGVDPNEDLLKTAKELSGHVTPPIEFRAGTAESLPNEDASFDSIISTFGVMFSSEPNQAAHELARVLKPGGRMVLASWIPGGAVEKTFALIRKFDPRRKAPRGGELSPMDWGRPEYLSRLFEPSFELIFEEGVSRAHFDNPDHMYEFHARGFGPLRELLASISEDAQRALRDEFIEVHDQYVVPAGIAIARPYLIVVGTRSSS